MDVVDGVAGLRPEHGPIFAVIGVFDGIHQGHVYLLDHLVREAMRREARPCVITFDHHPDEVLRGSAPPLLLDPEERLERLGGAGVQVTVVQHFDDTVRRTTYDDFIAAIRDGTALAGLLMTPDAAFGFERRGTPEAVAALAEAEGFDLVVVPPIELDGAPVRSSDIRTAIAAGDFARAERLLGRPVSLRGTVSDGRLSFEWPMAVPPDGRYECRIDARPGTAIVADGAVLLSELPNDGTVRVEFVA